MAVGAPGHATLCLPARAVPTSLLSEGNVIGLGNRRLYRMTLNP